MSAATPTGAPDCPDCRQPMQAAPGNPTIWLCPTCRMGWGVRALIAKAKADALIAALEEPAAQTPYQRGLAVECPECHAPAGKPCELARICSSRPPGEPAAKPEPKTGREGRWGCRECGAEVSITETSAADPDRTGRWRWAAVGGQGTCTRARADAY